jgi:hypothetical protein
MEQILGAVKFYHCPMHLEIRQTTRGKCPECGMALVPENARFGLLRHVVSSLLHLIAMAGLMALLMIAAMTLMR